MSSPQPTGPPPGLLPPPKSASKGRSGKRGLGCGEPSTFSGFKNLKALSVLDIDSIDIVPEIRACVKNSFSTLKELQLSLSYGLAQQSRKPLPDSDAEDSDLDSDFQVVSTSQSVSYDASAPAKAFRAQEQRKLHEAILGKILDIEQTLVKKSPIRPQADERAWDDAKGNDSAESATAQSSHEDFISSIKEASAKLIALQNGSRDQSASQQDILDVIEKAARKYVDSREQPPLQGTEGPIAAGVMIGEPEKGEDVTALDAAQQGIQGKAADCGAEEQGAHSEKATDGESPDDESLGENVMPKSLQSKLPGEELCPDDIDIAHVDMIGDGLYDFLEYTTSSPSGEGPTSGSATGAEARGPVVSDFMKTPCGTAAELRSAQAANQFSIKLRESRAAFRLLRERFHLVQSQCSEVAARFGKIQSEAAAEGHPKTGVFDVELQMLNQSLGEMSSELRAIAAESRTLPLMWRKAARTGDQNESPGEETVRRSMLAYARDTRGLSVQSLSIHLVPVKASVLSRGVDLAFLRQLTLLNVGNQAPIWTLLAKEGRTRPLALRSVFTDHVTTAFLSCMAQLPELQDLFLLERSVKHKPESFASRTTTTIDQIRRLVLRRHMPTLKRLMIKDESNGPNWDANEKTMILICTRGALLEELALSMNIHAVVSLDHGCAVAS